MRTFFFIFGFLFLFAQPSVAISQDFAAPDIGGVLVDADDPVEIPFPVDEFGFGLVDITTLQIDEYPQFADIDIDADLSRLWYAPTWADIEYE